MAFGYNHDERHAEVVALSKLWPSKRKGTRVYSVRVGRNGNLTMARPCVACMKFLRANKVKEVVYTDLQGNLVTERLR